jgi:hypothetical protein
LLYQDKTAGATISLAQGENIAHSRPDWTEQGTVTIMIEIRHRNSGEVIQVVDADSLVGVDLREDSLAI